MPPRVCPHCGSRNDGDTVLYTKEHTHPNPDDLSICLYCSGLSIYTETGLRYPTDEEFAKFMKNDRVQKAIAAMSMLRAEGKIPPCQP